MTEKENKGVKKGMENGGSCYRCCVFSLICPRTCVFFSEDSFGQQVCSPQIRVTRRFQAPNSLPRLPFMSFWHFHQALSGYPALLFRVEILHSRILQGESSLMKRLAHQMAHLCPSSGIALSTLLCI